MASRRGGLVLKAAAAFVACQFFILVFLPKAGRDNATAVLVRERPALEPERSDGCPDQPTFTHLASWEDWDRYNNCSLRVPWVSREHPREGGPLKRRRVIGTSLPLFLIIGEQKSGTTFLRMLLDQHPRLRAGMGLYGRPAGETHFFDKAVSQRFIPQEPARMAEAYAEYFPIHAGDMHDEDTMPFGFDTSPSYLAWQEAVPLRVSAVLPATKLLLLVRDPVQRYESARKMYLCFQKKVQEQGERFHEEHAMAAYLAAAASKKGSVMPVQRGLYMANLRRWLLHFQKEQVFVVDSHDLFHAPIQTLQLVLDFVGLPSFTPDVDRALEEGQNKGEDCGNHEAEYTLAQDDRDALAAFYHQPTQELERFQGRKLPWEKPPG